MAVPVLSPAGPLTKRGKQTQAFTNSGGAVTSWTATGGTLSATSGAGATWTVPNVSGTYKVRGTNSEGFSEVTITVMSVAVSVPSWKYEGDYDRKFLSWTPDSGEGDRQEQVKGPYTYTINMTANARQRVEFVEFLAHHQAHYGVNKNFYFTHPGTGTEYLMKYDAKLKEVWDKTNLVGYSTVMKQVQ
jgi:hypothetical protein